MGGRLQILHREWGEFKEAIGTALLGTDGGGLDIALGVVLPVFQVLNASCSAFLVP